MPSSYKFDPHIEFNATPRYKGDSFAANFQAQKANAMAAVAALRGNPLSLALEQDAVAPVEFNQTLFHPLAAGVWNYENDGKVRIRLNRPKENIENTLHHEKIHELQDRAFPYTEWGTPKYRGSPAATRAGGRSFLTSQDPVGNNETANEFSRSIAEQGLFYNPEEPAAFFTSNLLRGKYPRDERVAELFERFPILSTRFAQLNAQPNRPLPQHRKGWPEMSWLEKLRSYIGTGEHPALTDEDMLRGAQSYADHIRSLKGK